MYSSNWEAVGLSGDDADDAYLSYLNGSSFCLDLREFLNNNLIRNVTIPQKIFLIGKSSPPRSCLALTI